MAQLIYRDPMNIICLIFGIVFVGIGAASAWANAGSVLPSNIFEYGFAGAGYIILLYFCYRLLNMVKDQMEKSNDIIQKNTLALQELKSLIENRINGQR